MGGEALKPQKNRSLVRHFPSAIEIGFDGDQSVRNALSDQGSSGAGGPANRNADAGGLETMDQALVV